MIIQGVAGSGKTSIALHRIAFPLHRFKDQIGSKDIRVIAPKRVFADYKGLHERLGDVELCKPAGSKLDSADVFPLI